MARSTFALLHESLVAFGDLVQVVDVIVIVAGSSQEFERKIPDDGGRPVIQKEELPFQAVPRRELALCGIYQGSFSD